MPRGPRFQHADCYYHIISRGNAKKAIFLDERDFKTFLSLIRKIYDKFDISLHAYCLMPNHYHLFMHTQHANLSKALHTLQSEYAMYFNQRYDHVGHVFQGRFKSIIVDHQTYFKELSRYIHLNPVRAKIVNSPAQYTWSSYCFFTQDRHSPQWLDTKMTPEKFLQPGQSFESARETYINFVEKKLPAQHFLKKVEKGHFLGGDVFKEWLEKTFPGQMKQATRTKPDHQALAKVVENIKAQTPKGPYQKAMIAYYLKTSMHMNLEGIKDVIDYKSRGAVSHLLKKFEQRLKQNKDLAELTENL